MRQCQPAQQIFLKIKSLIIPLLVQLINQAVLRLRVSVARIELAISPAVAREEPSARREADDEEILRDHLSIPAIVLRQLGLGRTHANKAPNASPQAVVGELAPPTGVSDGAVVANTTNGIH